MFIKKTSGEFINSFIPTFKKNKKSSPKSKEYNNILKILYNDIYTAYINPRKTSCKKSNLNKITIKEVSKKPEMYNSNTRFFPLEIKKYINENEKYQLIYNCKVGGRDIRIYFTLFNEDDLLELDKYTECANMMYMWLDICASYSMKHCANTLDIYIYQTPFSKTLPDAVSTTIGTNNVNTAFTTWCSPKSEIVIYRDEEWFKVFIHETFHNLGLDFSDVDHKQNDILMTKLFNIENSNSSFRIYESYCEVWAEILNGFFVSFFQCENESACKNKFNKYMQKQIGFSVFQLVKILNYYHSNYSEFINKKTPIVKFKENTYVFSYYIVKTILLFHSVDFEKWCQDNNVNIFQFDRKNQNVLKYGRLIKTHYNKKPLLEYIQNMEKASSKFILNKDLLGTMRMTVEE